MPSRSQLPLLNHDPELPSAFTPEALMESVRNLRGHAEGPVPAICVLEFDGDLTDWLVANGIARRFDR
jgi:hypothetical protein